MHRDQRARKRRSSAVSEVCASMLAIPQSVFDVPTVRALAAALVVWREALPRQALAESSRCLDAAWRPLWRRRSYWAGPEMVLHESALRTHHAEPAYQLGAPLPHSNGASPVAQSQ